MKRTLFFLCLILGITLFAQEPSPVSIELAKAAALSHAETLYEKASFHSLTPYYDVDGNISVYCIVLKKPSGIDYSESQIIETLSKSYQELDGLRSELASINASEIIIEAKNEKNARIQKKIFQVESQSSFEEDYITVIAGADKKHVPVIMSYEGIPHHIRVKPELESSLRERKDLRQLGDVYYLGMFDLFYELKSASEQYDPPLLSGSNGRSKTTAPVDLVNLTSKETVSFDELRIRIENLQQQSLLKAGKVDDTEQIEKRQKVLKQKWDATESIFRNQASTVENMKSADIDQGEAKKSLKVNKHPPSLFQEPQLAEGILDIETENRKKNVDKKVSKPPSPLNSYDISNKKSASAEEVKNYILFSEDFSGSHPGVWSIGHGSGSVGGYSWAWPNGYAHCYSNPSATDYYYPNNLQVYMQRDVDLSAGRTGFHQLEFYLIVDTEENFDQFTVNIRDQYGTWHNFYNRSGPTDPLEWELVTLDLSQFDDQTGVRIQFLFESDGSVSGQSDEYAGVYIDNVYLSADDLADLSDLTPDVPTMDYGDWDDIIVVSAESGTNTESRVYEGNVAYLDFGWRNNDWDNRSGACRHYVYIDDELRLAIDDAGDLVGPLFGIVEDWQYVFTESGWHTIRLVLDAEGDVNEIYEDNNVYERQVFIEGTREEILSGVPDYEQRDYTHTGDISVATCLADVMGYWDRHSLWNLVDNGTAPLSESYTAGNVEATVEWFRSRYYDQGPSTSSTVFNALQEYCNNINGLDFNLEHLREGDYTVEHLFRFAVNEIVGYDPIGGKPPVWTLDNIQGSGTHCLPIIGYRNSGDPNYWALVHLNLGYASSAWVDWFGNDSYGINCNDLIIYEPDGIPVDDYEPDNAMTVTSASTIYPVQDNDRVHQYLYRQTHNFHQSSDIDYIKFYAEPGRRYTIETSSLGSNCDTYIQLLEDTGGGMRIIDENDDWGGNSASLIEWLCPNTPQNPYYIAVTEYNSNSGSLSNYDLEVSWVSVLTPPDQVINPDPPDGQTNVQLWPELSWDPSERASSYDIYFGTDPSPDQGEFIGNQSGITYNTNELNHDITYFWRIDAVNAAGTTTGTIWQFTTIEEDPDLSVSHTAVTLENTAGSDGSFDIYARNITWSITNIPSWLEVSPTSGTTDASVSLNARTANTAASDRSVILNISGGGITRHVTVTQLGTIPDPRLEVNPSEMRLGSASGSDQSVNVSSNVAWAITNIPSWLTVDPTSGTNDGSFTVTASSENTQTSDRNATLTISGGGLSSDITVVQSGANNDPYLVVSPLSLTLDKNSGSVGALSVQSNINWVVTTTAADWITINPLSGSNDGAIGISAKSANMTRALRSGKVIVSGGGLSKEIPVSQEAVPVSTIDFTVNNLDISLYPNPAINKVYLNSSSDISSDLILGIYDITGNLVVLQNIAGMVVDQSIELDISGFASGIYLLRLYNNDLTINRKLIVK